MSIDLFPTWVIGDVDLTSYPFSVDRENTVDIGEPEMVVDQAPVSIGDGDLERVVRYGNRVYSIDIYIEGPTLGELAEAEALLRTELRRDRIELTHNPGDNFSATSVYEVQTASLKPARRDDFEAHLVRKYTLTLTCLPFARSADLVTAAAIVAVESPSTVTINNANTTAGWTAWNFGASVSVVDMGDYVSATFPDGGLRSLLTLSMTATDVSSTRYVTYEASGTQPAGFVVFGPGVSASPSPVLTLMLPNGNTLYVLDVGDLGTITQVRIFPRGVPGTPVTVNVHDVSRTDRLPQVSPRQLARTIEVAGTERTPGSLQIVGNQNLGLTIIHTSPETADGYSPTVVRWRADGETPVTDSTALSGQRQALSPTSFGADIPMSSIQEGGYLLAARLRAVGTTGTLPIDWYTTTVAGGEALAPVGGQAHHDFFDDRWFFVSLAVLTLPSARANDGVVQIDLAGSNLELDEAWLFRVDDDCGLTILDNVPYSRVWIDSPDATSTVSRIWMGNEEDRSDARHPADRLLGQGGHTFAPGPMAVFTATVGVSYPEVSLSHYPRWHSNAAS